MAVRLPITEIAPPRRVGTNIASGGAAAIIIPAAAIVASEDIPLATIVTLFDAGFCPCNLFLRGRCGSVDCIRLG